MNRLCQFLLLLSAASAMAAGPALQEQPLPAIKGSISLPEGWAIKDQSEEDAPVYQITREKPAVKGGETPPGILLSVTTKVPERTKADDKPGMAASAYAAELLPTDSEPGAKELKKTTEGDLQVFRTSFVDDDGQTKVAVEAFANDKTGTLYYLEWRSSMMEEADLKEVREAILSSLKLDPAF